MHHKLVPFNFTTYRNQFKIGKSNSFILTRELLTFSKQLFIMSQTVNGQITDAVTQTNVKVVAEAPAIALGNVYQSAAHSTGLMFENAVNAQSQQNILAQTATTQGVMQIYSFDTIADAISISTMLNAS